MIELRLMGLSARNQVPIEVTYKGHDLGMGFRAGVIAENCLVLELKTVKELNDNHLAQIMAYQKLLGFKRGYLLNFHGRLMKDGIRRVSM